MVERVKRASQQALVIALVTLATNGVQWATARSQAEAERRMSERRDELLASAFERSTRALDDARRVLEAAEARCAKSKALPKVMYREEVPSVPAPDLGIKLTPTQLLDRIATREALERLRQAHPMAEARQ